MLAVLTPQELVGFGVARDTLRDGIKPDRARSPRHDIAQVTKRSRRVPNLDLGIRRFSAPDAVQKVARMRIVRIVDEGLQDGVPWYAMDLLQGDTLRQYVRRLSGDPHWTKKVDGHTIPRTGTSVSSNESLTRSRDRLGQSNMTRYRPRAPFRGARVDYSLLSRESSEIQIG